MVRTGVCDPPDGNPDQETHRVPRVLDCLFERFSTCYCSVKQYHEEIVMRGELDKDYIVNERLRRVSCTS